MKQEVPPMRHPSFFRRYFALMGVLIIHAILLLGCTAAFAFVFIKYPAYRLAAYAVCALVMVFLFFPLYTALGGAAAELYRGNPFRPFCLSGYAVKWAIGATAFLRSPVFFVPLAASAVYAYNTVKAYDELTALIPLLCDLGAKLRPDGGLADGIYGLIGIFACLFAVGLLGGFFVSSIRYAFLEDHGVSFTLARNRSLLRGNRVSRVGVFLLNLLTWAPFLVLLYYFGRDTLEVFLIDWSFEQVDFLRMWPLIPAWLLPAPLRPMITCSHLLKKEA